MEFATITLFDAGNGDPILVEQSDPHSMAILVDGGYAATFRTSIRPKLETLKKNGRKIDLLVSTHVDADHIGGVLELVRANADPPNNVIAIERIWHNSLRSLIEPSGTAELTMSDVELLREIANRGMKTPDESKSEEISARQGSSLAALISSGNYDWNGGDGTEPIIESGRLEISSDCHIAVVAPGVPRLRSLREWWLSELRNLGFSDRLRDGALLEDVCEFISSHELPDEDTVHEISNAQLESRELSDIYKKDSSVVNGSSIVFILHMRGKRLLFLADAWAEDIVEFLSKTYGKSRVFFDAIKLSHHGSYRNTSPALLDLVDAQRFLILTDGSRHSHPDYEVLKAIVDRPANFERHLYFNGCTASSTRLKSHVSKSGAKFSVHENTTTFEMEL